MRRIVLTATCVLVATGTAIAAKPTDRLDGDFSVTRRVTGSSIPADVGKVGKGPYTFAARCSSGACATVVTRKSKSGPSQKIRAHPAR